MKKFNILSVFRLIQAHSPVSKRELEKLSGLSWGTISFVTNELLSRGFLEAIKSSDGKVGRTPNMLKINHSKNFCLGIDVNISCLTFVLADLSGSIVEERSVVPETASREDVLKVLFKNTEHFVKVYDVLSISFSMQGQIDRSSGVSLGGTHFKDWKDVPLKELFRERFGVRTEVYHDPDCLMTYHIFRRKQFLQDAQNCILLRMNGGIGMSLLFGGRIYEGNRGVVAEIGHTTIVPEGALCRCGKRGCLEAYCSSFGMADRYNERFGKSLSVDEFCGLLDQREPGAVALAGEMGVYLGYALANLINILNPESICLDGDMTRYSDIFLPGMNRIISEQSCNAQRIVIADYQKEAPALGAVLKTVDAALEEIVFPGE